jgi:hypothetical protein
MHRTSRSARLLAPLARLGALALAAASVESVHLGQHQAAPVAGAPGTTIRPLDSCIVRYPLRICLNPT